MRLKYNFEMVDFDNEIMAIPLGAGNDELHAIIKLNKAASEIFELLKKDISEDAIVDFLTDKYENDRNQIINFVRNFIAMLNEKELIVD